MWQELLEKVKTKLEAHTGAGKTLFAVYTNPSGNFEGYPCAAFVPSNKEEDFRTLSENMSTYAIDVYIYQEMENAGNSDAVQKIAGALDALEADFRQDYTLGGTVRLLRPVPAEWGADPGGNGWLMFGKLKLICEVNNYA